MEREIGRRLIDAIASLDGPLGIIDHLVSGLEESDTKRDLIAALQKIYGHLFVDMMQPIFRKFPELDEELSKKDQDLQGRI